MNEIMNVPESIKDLSLIFMGFFSIILSSFALHFSIRKDKINAKTKFIDELLKINSLTIDYPELRLVHQKVNEENKKELNDENKKARLTSFCYKYLNILDLLFMYYPKYFNNRKKLIEIKKQDSYISNWLEFYQKSLGQGTLGYIIIIEILNKINETGDYSEKFSTYVKKLLSPDNQLKN